MALTFDKIPSEIEIPLEVPRYRTVEDEINSLQPVLQERLPKCKTISALHKRPKKNPLLYSYKFFCVCPRYCPQYLCKHAGNIIIDRDVLTKEEHICYLATPKENLGAPRKMPRYYQKKVVVPNCTSRIERLALPDLKRVRNNLVDFKHILNKKTFRALKNLLIEKPEVEYTSINKALEYIEEERRLQHVAKTLEKRRCRRFKRSIVRKQRRQIRKIICVLFEEMKDFLLNDQFLIDERSTLCAVILDQIREFTDKDFYTTSNLREYQQILANNLTIWINKFISNLNIHVAPPPQERICRPDPDTFLPVKDYISCSETLEGEEEDYPTDIDFVEYVGEEMDDVLYEPETRTEDTVRNTNP